MASRLRSGRKRAPVHPVNHHPFVPLEDGNLYTRRQSFRQRSNHRREELPQLQFRNAARCKVKSSYPQRVLASPREFLEISTRGKRINQVMCGALGDSESSADLTERQSLGRATQNLEEV